MYQDFIAALNRKYQCAGKSDLSGLDLQHYTFASTTNVRGADTLKIFEAYGFSISGLRILDVGCAYGGFSIEAARKGACCYGVEISPPLYEFALLNGQNETYDGGSCTFIQADATSPEFLEKLPHHFFDLIIVNDVFEHVYDTVQLLSNLDQVGNDKCAVYFLIPNGNDLSFVAREGHTGCCGLTLLRPLQWRRLDDREQNIYYRQYEYYQALFQYFGFGNVDPINYPGCTELEEMKARIAGEYAKTKETVSERWDSFPSGYAAALKTALEGYDRQLQYDLDHLGAPELGWKYLTRFWAGFAGRKPLALTPPRRTTERKSRSDADCYGIQFELSLDGDTLSIDVTSADPEEELEFAFHLMRREVSIERSHYQREPRYKWKLCMPGIYGAAIYVKKPKHARKDIRILTQPLYFAGN